MSETRTFRRLLTLVLATLMFAPVLLPAADAGNPNPSPAQAEVIDDDVGDLGGDWVERTELVPFYLHTTGLTGEAFANAPGDAFTMDLERPRASISPLAEGPTAKRSVAVGFSDVPVAGDVGEAVFYGNLTVQDEIPILGGEYVLYLSGVTAGARATAEFWSVDPEGNLDDELRKVNLVPDFDASTGAGDIPTATPYRGSFSFEQVDGFVLPEGWSIAVAVAMESVAPIGTPAVLHMDTSQYDSRLTLTTRSVGINAWTEDRHGDDTDHFPTASSVASIDRRVVTRWVHTNHWGNEDCAGVNDAADLCQRDALDQTRMALRIRDVSPEHDDYLQLVPLDIGLGLEPGDPGFGDREAKCCNTVFAPIEYINVDAAKGIAAFEHTFAYPADFLDGTYQVEIQEEGQSWEVLKRFTIGETGFSFEFAPGESPTHIINPGEPTDFVLRLQNDGSTTDTFGVSAPVPGGGWSASIVPGTVTLAPGAHQDVTVTVTPPPTALSGAQRTVVVSAVSLIDNSVKTLTTQTAVTNVVLRDVSLQPTLDVLELRPGFERNFHVVLKNEGTAADQFVVTASGAPAGWTVLLTPSFTDLNSQSRQDLILHVEVPESAVPGTSFTLDLVAKRTADAGVSDTVELPVTVFLIDDLLLGELENDHQLREISDSQISTACDAFLTAYSTAFISSTDDCTDPEPVISEDHRFDDAILHRIRLNNLGDREDTYTLSASWVPDSAEDTGCDGTGTGDRDGVPDGWRYRLLPSDGVSSLVASLPDSASGNYGAGQVTTDGGGYFSGEQELGSVTVPAGSAIDAYVEIHWDEADCGFGRTLSWRAFDPLAENTLRVTVRSDNDDTLLRRSFISTTLTDAGVVVDESGRSPAAVHGIRLEPEIGQAVNENTSPGTSQVYSLRAINTGNEEDGLRIRVPIGQDGWDYEIVDGSWSILDSHVTDLPNPDVREARECTAAQDLRTLTCTGMGVFDEVRFDVEVSAPASADIGDRDTMTIAGVSLGFGAGEISDTITLHTRVAGDFDFTAEELGGDLHTARTQSSSFPFTIHNIGTETDTYQLEIVEGDGDWQPFLSGLPEVTVPAESDFHGFLTVTAPASAPLGFESFRVAVRSVGGQETQFLDFTANVTAIPQLSLASDPITVPPGQTGVFEVTASDLAGDADDVTFTIDTDSLPAGWEPFCNDPDDCNVVVGGDSDTRSFGSNDEATGDFGLEAPSGQLGLSRFTVRVMAETDTGVVAYHDAVVNLASLFDVQLQAANGTSRVAAPGFTTTHDIEVFNTGNAPLTVELSNNALPAGWSISYDAQAFTVQPQVRQPVQIVLTAPEDADPGSDMTLVVFANTVEDPSAVDQIALTTTIGDFAPQVSAPNETVFMAPLETRGVVLTAVNNGTVDDRIALVPTLPSQYTDLVRVDFDSGCTTSTAEFACIVEVSAGEAKQVRVELTLPAEIAGEAKVPITWTARSALSVTGASAQDTLDVEVLRFISQDIDGDQIDEFAVDRDQELDNGYDAFREAPGSAGIVLRPIDLTRFLSDEAREEKTTTQTIDGQDVEVFTYVIDGDEDGRVDHFLDDGSDGLPDIYWDPDGRIVSELDVTKDLNGDLVREYLVDVDGDGLYDVFFDLVAGEFGDLIQVDADGDGMTDYIADLNGNGQGDQDEPVFYARTGGIVIIEAIDVDGDGRLDQVLDDDGDGVPDRFIPAGSTESIEIVMQDVDGDGQDDWTYDADGDGERDSYYNPATGESGLIDSRNVFIRALEDYWYVGALFLLVAALFVVLMIVTRR